MKHAEITRNCLAIVCLLTTSLFVDLLFVSSQENEKKAAKPGEVGIKGQITKERAKQEKQSGDAEESSETDEQMAVHIRQQKLQLMVGEVIARLSQIEPVEMKILAYVETAATLWKHDRPRAYQMIEQGIELLDRLYDKKTDNGVAVDMKTVKAEKEARERFIKIIIRKIAVLDASLAAKLEKDRQEKKEDAKIQYTETAQAVMDTAVSLAKEDPVRAAQTARDSVSQDHGIPYDTITILFALHAKDKAVAEKLAMDFIRRFEALPYSLVNFTLIAQYVFFKEGSTEQLRDLYFNAFANRLRNDMLLAPSSEYLPRLRSTLLASLRLAADYPKSQQQFEQLRVEVENYLTSRQLVATQGVGPRQVIDMSDLSPAKEGDTQSIRDAQAWAAMLADPYQRDKEYGWLATSAAQKADQSLAEELLGKIKDDRVRSAASVSVYGPLIRKALVEKDWSRAQYLSAKIADPLGRSFVLIDVAGEMTAAKAEKDVIVNFYVGGLNQLQAAPESLNVAKAYLALVNPLLSIDSTLALTAARGAVRSFNSSKLPRPYSSDTALARGAAVWGQRAREELGGAQEMFEPSDILPRVFHALAVKKPLESQMLVDQFFDRGLQTFAQLGIISAEWAKQSNPQTQQKVRGGSPALSKPKEKRP